jgi:hypothetical protein
VWIISCHLFLIQQPTTSLLLRYEIKQKINIESGIQTRMQNETPVLGTPQFQMAVHFPLPVSSAFNNIAAEEMDSLPTVGLAFGRYRIFQVASQNYKEIFCEDICYIDIEN